MYTVPGQQTSARGRDVTLDIGKEGFGCGGRAGGRGADGGREARATVRVNTPRVHGVEGGVGVVDDGLEAGIVEELELGIGDEAADLEDLVVFGVETGHLCTV